MLKAFRVSKVMVCICLMQICISVDAQGQMIADNQQESVERLEVLQSLLDAKIAERKVLRESIRDANAEISPELKLELDALNEEIGNLRQTFETIAIDTIDMDLFGEVQTNFDLQVEITQILQPMIENLKALTEKPRKIERLRSIIERNLQQQETIVKALESIQAKVALSDTVETKAALEKLHVTWTRRQKSSSNEFEVATFQLNQLLTSDETWLDSTVQSLMSFFRGRGLTLLITFVVAVLVWWLMRGVLWLFQRKSTTRDIAEFRTRQRLAQYAYRALTFILILIAVVSVFYMRGDVLLMGLSILAAVAIALGLRNTVPRFLAETRLLLNIGPLREDERVMYNGLPWQVVSLNMYSVLRNPELTGVIRLPLSSLREMVSRPAGKEHWFPTSKGDFIVLTDGALLEVIRQTPETVELKNRGGTITSVPSGAFYDWTFENLTRGGTFGVKSMFGIDYRHLAISRDVIPTRFANALKESLAKSELAEHVQEVVVELSSAGSSSLDYWIYLTMRSGAAKAYTRLDRLIQQTCVSVCAAEDWGIPFPHLTVQTYTPD